MGQNRLSSCKHLSRFPTGRSYNCPTVVPRRKLLISLLLVFIKLENSFFYYVLSKERPSSKPPISRESRPLAGLWQRGAFMIHTATTTFAPGCGRLHLWTGFVRRPQHPLGLPARGAHSSRKMTRVFRMSLAAMLASAGTPDLQQHSRLHISGIPAQTSYCVCCLRADLVR